MTYWLTAEDYRDKNMAMVEAMEPYKADFYRRLKQKAKEKKFGEIERLRREIRGLE